MNLTNQDLESLWKKAERYGAQLRAIHENEVSLRFRGAQLNDELQLRIGPPGRCNRHRYLTLLPLRQCFEHQIRRAIAGRSQYRALGETVLHFLRSPGRYEPEFLLCVRRLLRVVTEAVTGQDLPSYHRFDLPDWAVVLALPEGLVDSELAAQFLSQRGKAAGNNQSARCTANAILSAARAVFRDWGDEVPLAIQGFLEEPPLTVTRAPKQALSLPVLERILAAMARLENEAPAAALILVTALYDALRKNEVLNFAPQWLNDTEETPVIHVQHREGALWVKDGARYRQPAFTVKMGAERLVPTANWRMLMIQQLSQGEDYILGDNPSARKDAYKLAIKTLRDCGVKGKRPLYVLRETGLTQRSFMKSLQDGQATGGHTTANMTLKRYFQQGYTKEHAALIERGPGDMIARFSPRDWEI